MWKTLEIEIPSEYFAELQKAADEAQITLNSQICVAIAGWMLRRVGSPDARETMTEVKGGQETQ